MVGLPASFFFIQLLLYWWTLIHRTLGDEGLLIGDPIVTNPDLRVHPEESLVDPSAPICRLQGPRRCCKQLWHLEFWNVYVDIYDSYPGYLKYSVDNPNLMERLPLHRRKHFNYLNYQAPFEADNAVAYNPNSPLVSYIEFECWLTSDLRDPFTAIAILRHPDLRNRRSRRLRINCEPGESAREFTRDSQRKYGGMRRIHSARFSAHLVKDAMCELPTSDVESETDPRNLRGKRPISHKQVAVNAEKKTCLSFPALDEASDSAYAIYMTVPRTLDLLPGIRPLSAQGSNFEDSPMNFVRRQTRFDNEGQLIEKEHAFDLDSALGPAGTADDVLIPANWLSLSVSVTMPDSLGLPHAYQLPDPRPQSQLVQQVANIDWEPIGQDHKSFEPQIRACAFPMPLPSSRGLPLQLHARIMPKKRLE